MLNEAPYHRGSYIQAASRIAPCSSYGTNFHLMGHFRLHNMIPGSPSWTEPTRRKVYGVLVIPAVAELAKFPGALFNMTDITNYDLVLAGLSFNDANILYRGLPWDSGLLKRLTDIGPDGFSSEALPLNYHYASMAEYIRSVPFIRRSELKIEIPVELLKSAVRMPYERATLSDYVATTGDMACGLSVRPGPLYDVACELSPERWLYELGTRSTLRTFFKARKEGQPDKNAWRKYLKTEPTPFPYAGFAILHSDTTGED